MIREKGLRLGPLLILLCLVAISLATLGVLSFSSGRADLLLSRRYAENVRERYQLDSRGQKILKEAEDTGISAQVSSENYRLEINKAGNSLQAYRLERLWENDEAIHGLWQGE